MALMKAVHFTKGFHCLKQQQQQQTHLDQKQFGKGKDLFELTSVRSHSITEGNQGRNLGAGTEAKALEECCLWACSAWLAQYFCNTTQDNPPSGASTLH